MNYYLRLLINRAIFTRLLQVRPGPHRSSIPKNLLVLLVRDYLQVGCRYWHPTNNFKALKD